MHFVSTEIEAYCLQHSTQPSPICASLATFTREQVPYPQMLSGPLEASFLGFLLSLTGARRVLEIGCYTGYSALAMAENLPSDGEVITLDINEETSKIAKDYWARSLHGRKIQLHLGPALQSLGKLTGTFDAIFLDADKENYRAYLEQALPLLAPKGFIAADNCLYSGQVLHPQKAEANGKAIHVFNEYVKGRTDLQSTLLPLRDGVFLIQKKG